MSWQTLTHDKFTNKLLAITHFFYFRVRKELPKSLQNPVFEETKEDISKNDEIQNNNDEENAEAK